jgi:hypothetical protein
MGGARQVILALAVLAAGAAATPAGAVDVAGTSARLRWSPASGPVAAYAVWVIHQSQPAPSAPSMAALTNEAVVSGAVGDTVQVQVAALDAQGVVGPRSPLSAPIRFVAAPTSGSAPRLTLSTQSVSLSALRRGAAAPAAIQIGNAGGGSLAWTARASARWVVLGPATAGSAPATLQIGASALGLAPGVHQATVTVTPGGSGATPQTVQVVLQVAARTPGRTTTGGGAAPATLPSAPSTSSSAAQLQVSTLGLSVNASVGQNPPAQSFSVRNAGGGTLPYQIAPGASWLAVSPASGSSQGEADPVRVSIASAGLAAGTYHSSIVVSAPGVPSASVAVTLVVGRAQAHAQARPYDLDGDGHSDVITRDAAGSYEVTLLGDKGPIARTALGQVPPAGASLAGSGDLDGDGKADLVWSDPSAGGLQLWLMNGAVPSATRALPLGGRSLVAVADFDGDGKADLLLNAGGTLELWPMDGLQTGVTTSGIASLGSSQVVGAADLNQDGRADLVLATRDASGTRYSVATLLGARLTSTFALPLPAAGLTLVAAGPCGGGGAPGLLWQSPASGGLMLWSLARRRVASQEALDVTLPADWELVATGDFSGDGRTDLLVRPKNAGALVVIALDGPSMVGGFLVSDSLPADTQVLNR